MTNISEWSPTAGLNTASPPDGAPEGMARSAVNDTMREMMGAIARFYRDVNGLLVAGGTANAITLTTNSVYTALADVGTLTFRATNGNTGATTLTVDALAAKSLTLRDGTALFIGDIRDDQMVTVVYNSNQDRFELVTEVGDRPGTVKSWAGATEPTGWLFGYGQEVSRTTYATLFAVIGETYGEGDTSTTFNLPDLRGRVVAYRDDMGGDAAERLADQLDGTVLGEAGGHEELAQHDHAVSQHTHGAGSLATASSGAHTHDAGVSTSVDQPGGVPVRSVAAGNVATTSDGAHTHTISGSTATGGPTSTSDEGDGDSGNIQPTLILNGIIKT